MRIRSIVILAVFVIVALLIVVGLAPHVYLLSKLEPNEVGVKLRSGQIVAVVGPGGVYSDIGLYASLEKIDTGAIPIDVSDPELITQDKQRVGLQVTADAFRPGVGKMDILQEKWASYRAIYTDDSSLQNRVGSFALQAMKVCVGNRTFDQSVIGSGRDDLRQCIDTELSALASQVGLDVQNVVVPQVIISPEVQVALDSIVQSRLMTEKARQDAEKAKQEAAARQAAQEGEIRVQQSAKQETARQQAILADLERQQLEAQLAVIKAQTNNALKQKDLRTVEAQIATIQAQIDIANNLAMAKMFAENPGYLQYQVVLANASAIKATDKLIFVPEGTMPSLIFSSGNTLPSYQVNPGETIEPK
jgi:hypothetical protein